LLSLFFQNALQQQDLHIALLTRHMSWVPVQVLSERSFSSKTIQRVIFIYSHWSSLDYTTTNFSYFAQNSFRLLGILKYH
jgi:hypothetical protein